MAITAAELELINQVALQVSVGRSSDPIDLTELMTAFMDRREEIMQALAKQTEELSNGNWTLRPVPSDMFVRALQGPVLYVAVCPADLDEKELLGHIGWNSPQVELMVIGPFPRGVIYDLPLGEIAATA